MIYWFAYICHARMAKRTNHQKHPYTSFHISFKYPIFLRQVLPGVAGQIRGFPMEWNLVPLTGGRYHIIPQLAVYTTYIPLIVLAYWVIIYHRYHLLREPETAIEFSQVGIGFLNNPNSWEVPPKKSLLGWFGSKPPWSKGKVGYPLGEYPRYIQNKKHSLKLTCPKKGTLKQ